MTHAERIEQEREKPPVGVLTDLRDQGLTQEEAAERLSVSVWTVRAWCRRHGVRWPMPENAKERTRAHRRARCERPIRIGGRDYAFHEAAKAYGVPISTLWDRWTKGKRGRDLIRKPRRKRPVPDHYQVGLSIAEWRQVLSLVPSLGQKKVADKYGIPFGAITYAMNGQWDRLD